MARNFVIPPPPEFAAIATPAPTEPVPSPTPSPASRRRRALRGPVLVAGLALATTGYIAVANPNQPGHFPLCPLKAVTGLDCPMCGGLRSVDALTHGDLVGALNQNLFAVLCYPVLIWLWLRWARLSWQSADASCKDSAGATSTVLPSWWNRYLGYGILVVFLLFSVARDLPFIPFLRSGLG
jgi:hypothetical protein